MSEMSELEVSAAISDIITNANGAANVTAATSGAITAIAEQVRLFREDGPTLEALADKLEAAAQSIAGAVASRPV